MAYAAAEDVLARAGRFAGLFAVEDKRPNEDDVDAELDDVSAIIDAEILARGFDPALLNDAAEAALKDVTAWAALARLLPSASPGDEKVMALADRAAQIVTAAGFPMVLGGGAATVLAALAQIEAGQGGGGAGSSAGSLWDTFPQLEALGEDDAEALEPTWRRGQHL